MPLNWNGPFYNILPVSDFSRELNISYIMSTKTSFGNLIGCFHLIDSIIEYDYHRRLVLQKRP